MVAQQLPLAAPAHNNRQLFADHYLDTTLPARGDWQMRAAAVGPLLARIAALYAAFTPSNIEAQTERDLVQPILAALGHTFEVQAALRTPDGTKKPDYVFYRDRAELDANKDVTLTEERLRPGGLAVGDAKYWDRPLDVTIKATGGDPFTNKNPSYQIAFYIQHSGLSWGILTNGRLWRLYHRDTAHRLDRFYEVDLPALLADNDPARFLYFAAFFGRDAFEDRPLGVAALLKESADYAQGVGNTLKAQVYEALRHLAQGFLDYPGNRLDADDPATRKAIYDNALIVLYRLLFILYAEARELLPVRQSGMYRDSYSLYAITRDIAAGARLDRRLLPGTATLWPRLVALFDIIDAGSPPLGVATFNGGLFDPARHPFLTRYTVGDARLHAAIDKLARVHGEFVDFRDLAERHLGTIYEGLLEFHLATIAPDGEWTIDLLNDKGERHATGSYYTPDYIVQYMVEQTVGPVLRAAVAGKATDQEKIAAVLGVNVLDPAMGSGHFPVAATEYIARFLVDLAVSPEGDAGSETDLAYWKRRVAQSCIYGVDLNPLAVELAKLSLWLVTVAQDRPLSFLDHHLRTGDALIGARLADLQIGVQDTTARKRPSKRVQQAAAAGQLSMLDDDTFRQSMGSAVSSMWQIEGTAGDTIAEVKAQERAYAHLRDDLNRKYGRLADLVSATHFGAMIDAALWTPLADFAMGRTIAAPARFTEWLDAADRVAGERRFFHWELEFPEVYFDRDGLPLGEHAGFDAVIGNPPYVRQEQMAPIKRYLAETHGAVYDGVADLYVYFYHLGVEALRVGGKMSYIVTNKWLRAGYGEPLRRYFAAHAVVERIVDFGHAPIFPDADVFPCIVVLSKPSGEPGTQGEQETQVCLFPRAALGQISIASYVADHSYPVPTRRFTAQPWSLEPADVDDLMAKIRRAGVPLSEFVGVRPFYGLKTGLNEAFLIDTPTRDQMVRADPECAEIIRPYLRGQDMERWQPAWQRLWIILLKSSSDHPWPWSTAPEEAEEIFARTYPALYRHMKPLEAKLRERQDQGQYWWELRSCAYYSAFEQPKIMYQVIQFHPQYGHDSSGLLTNDKGFFISRFDPWLLAVLNSPLMWWHNWRYLPHMKDEALNPAGVLMATLPIAPPTDAVRSEAEPAVARLIALTHERRATTRELLEWLRVEFAVESPGQRLAAFATLDDEAFVEEVRRRRPRVAGRLTPAALRDLRETFAQSAPQLRALVTEAQQHERRVAELVNAAYGLTPADVDLLWRTAPPRMPVGR